MQVPAGTTAEQTLQMIAEFQAKYPMDERALNYLLQSGAEAKQRVAEEQKRMKDEEYAKKKAAEEAVKKAAEEQKVKDEVDRFDKAALDALHARQQDLDLGPILATKNSSILSRRAPKTLRLEDDNKTFTYACPEEQKGRMGNNETKHLHLKNITQVNLADPTKPNVFRFKAGHKEYMFVCQSEDDCQLLIMGLRAAASRLAKKPGQFGKGSLRLAVPQKAFGLINASVLERRPAFPEEHRSVVLGDEKKRPITRD